MVKTQVCTYIDADVKEMAKARAINMSKVLESSLEAELDIAEFKDDEKDKIIARLKLKIRKNHEIMRDLRTEMAKKEADFVRFRAKNQPKPTDLKPGETIRDLRNDPDRWNKLSIAEKKQINSQLYGKRHTKCKVTT